MRVVNFIGVAVCHLRSRLRRAVFRLICGWRPWTRPKLVRLGSDYGGWWVPESALRAGHTAYCAGAGEDISFDLALLERGLLVRTIDPTPRAISYVRGLGIHAADFAFAPVGVWKEDGIVKLYAPHDPSHVSHSILNLQRTDRYIEARVESLATLQKRFGDGRVDLLKLDIEGAEYGVLEALEQSTLRPSTLCVEFDQPQPLWKARRAIIRLRRLGYRPVRMERFNVSLILDSNAGKSHLVVLQRNTWS